MFIIILKEDSDWQDCVCYPRDTVRISLQLPKVVRQIEMNSCVEFSESWWLQVTTKKLHKPKADLDSDLDPLHHLIPKDWDNIPTFIYNHISNLHILMYLFTFLQFLLILGTSFNANPEREHLQCLVFQT